MDGDMDGDMDGAQDRGRPLEIGLLALLYATAGLFCVAGAAWPLSPDTPVGLSAALGGTGLGVAALLWVLGPRAAAAPHAALGLLTLLAALLAARSVTAVGVVGLGPVVIAVGLYAAHFCSLAAARTHVGSAVGLITVGALAARPHLDALPWGIAMATAVVLTECHARLVGRLQAAASTDPLTGLANRRAWEAEATRSLARARRAGEPITIAVLDLDGFKAVNDRDGHVAGDELLRTLTALWSQRLRRSDLLGRQGGDEFVLCLPDTDPDGAQEVLDRLAEGAPATWSVGTAVAGAGDTLAAVLHRADVALYTDKRRRHQRSGPDGAASSSN